MRRMEYLHERERKKLQARQLRAEYASLYRSLSSKNTKFKRMENIKRMLYGSGGD
jgi:hypothetical protein